MIHFRHHMDQMTQVEDFVNGNTKTADFAASFFMYNNVEHPLFSQLLKSRLTNKVKL